MTRRVLKDLSTVTYCVDDLAASVAAWTDLLGYRLVDDTPVSQAQAAAWNTPAAAGLPCCLLQTPSGEEVFIRYIQTGERRGFESRATTGWTATELLVQDPDGLAMQLSGSVIQRLAGPGDLFPGPKAPRAMQAIGPCGELLYFTRILAGGSRYGMKQARTPVDRPFIVTIAGDSMPAMHEFYQQQLGMRVFEPMAFNNGILAHSCGAPPGTIFPTSVSPIPGRRFLIEFDEFPAGRLPTRARSAGLPPPGMAMVSCQVASLDEIGLPFRAPPVTLDGPPYHGRRAAVIAGATGEWLELLEGDRKCIE